MFEVAAMGAILLAVGLVVTCFWTARRDRSAADRPTTATSGEDLQQLIEFMPQAAWVTDGRGRLLSVSPRWYDWTGMTPVEARTHAWTHAIHPDEHERVLEEWNKARRTGSPYDVRFRIRLRNGKSRWIRSRAYPRYDAAQRIERWYGLMEDIDDQVAAEQQALQTSSLLELIGLSTEGIIWAKDREGRMLYINRALEELAGVKLGDVLGKTDPQWNPHADQAQAFQAADQRVLDSGEGDDVLEEFTGADGKLHLYRSIRSPLRDRQNNVIGVVGVATDVTEQREAQLREQLLARELDHRAKNMLTVVQSVVALTRATGVEDFKHAVTGRIQAMGHAHSMLAASRWDGADLRRLVEEELAPFQSADGQRLTIDGPPVLLRPAAAQSIALVLHELATNAVKYGALSRADGTLGVQWLETRCEEDGAPCLELQWREELPGGGDLRVRPPTRTGFGSRLIQSSIERQLGGRLDTEWRDRGLQVTLEIPLERTLGSPPLPPRSADPHAAKPAATRRRTRRRAA